MNKTNASNLEWPLAKKKSNTHNIPRKRKIPLSILNKTITARKITEKKKRKNEASDDLWRIDLRCLSLNYDSFATFNNKELSIHFFMEERKYNENFIDRNSKSVKMYFLRRRYIEFQNWRRRGWGKLGMKRQEEEAMKVERKVTEDL